ncbi:MAG: hypothetical protein M3N82_08025 [Pseudomonadota bacterium]|nr:hypothetical protein [Pseudomonadota bacterium]
MSAEDPARVEHPAAKLVAWQDLEPVERHAVLRLESSLRTDEAAKPFGLDSIQQR